MLYLYTENLFAANKAKYVVKKLLGRQNRGPMTVFGSLEAGLRERGESFCVNQKIVSPIEAACVVSGAKTLKWAVSRKRNAKIKKIIAGPNIVVFPSDEGGILRDPLVDVIIVPSQWVKELYCLLAPELSGKIRIWPAGVALPQLALREKDLDFLIYDKTRQSPLCRQIVDALRDRNYRFKILSYGNFRQKDYFGLLERCKYEIYLSVSESQGLAMFEAWARNVPTFVWEAGRYEKQGVKLTGQISSPYLSPRAGLSFKDSEDFKNKLGGLLKMEFLPRRYVEENFTDKICAQKYLDIVYGQ